MREAPTDVLVTITGTHLAESAKAIKFQVLKIDGTPIDPPKTEWFPFSQVRKIFKNPHATGEDYLMATEWICKAKELV